jgi:nucleotide-binding universal stress UspA family protein
MIRIRRILYPTDFTPFSAQAYFHAVTLAEAHGAALTILHVLVPSHPAPEAAGDPDPRAYWKRRLEEVRPADPRVPVQHLLLDGDPAAAIVEHACTAGTDLIVMGTHGRTGLERLLLGSVAEKVIREAPCSVLVVKLPRGVPVGDTPAVAAVAASPA